MTSSQGMTWMSPGHWGQNRKMRKYGLCRERRRKKIRERIKKIKKREGRSRVDSSPRKVWKGKRRGQAPDSHAAKVAALPQTCSGIRGCFNYFGGGR